jgi:signal transduction histidine kinase
MAKQRLKPAVIRKPRAGKAAAKKRTAAMRERRRAPREIFAALDRAQQLSADEKVRSLLHELQVHAEEINAQNEQLRKAQSELEQARDRYADLYDFAPIGYLTLSRTGTITDVNFAGASLLGQKLGFLKRLPLSAAVHPTERLRLRRFLHACWLEPLAPAQTIELRTKDTPSNILRFTCRSQGAGRSARLFTTMVDVTEERRLEHERATALDRIKALLDRLVGVQEDERRRIARNLHDHLGQQLTALRLNIGSLKDTERSSEDFRTRLESIDKIASGLDRDLDFLAWELRPVALDDVGLNAALAAFIKEWSATQDLPAEFHDSSLGAIRLTPDIESQLYRIVQEALNNVAKHAGAKCVSVLLERRGEDVILIVEDDGTGFNPDDVATSSRNHPGLGLVSMQERAALVGGNVQFESARGKGTTVFVRIPLRTVPLLPP